LQILLKTNVNTYLETQIQQNYASIAPDITDDIVSAGLEQVTNRTRTSTRRENRFFTNLRNDYDDQLQDAEQNSQDLQQQTQQNADLQAQNQQLATAQPSTTSFLELW
jgi:hypothetical protein